PSSPRKHVIPAEVRHPRASGDPPSARVTWGPACAGVTYFRRVDGAPCVVPASCFLFSVSLSLRSALLSAFFFLLSPLLPPLPRHPASHRLVQRYERGRRGSPPHGELVLRTEKGALRIQHLEEIGNSLLEAELRQLQRVPTRLHRLSQFFQPCTRTLVRNDR